MTDPLPSGSGLYTGLALEIARARLGGDHPEAGPKELLTRQAQRRGLLPTKADEVESQLAQRDLAALLKKTGGFTASDQPRNIAGVAPLPKGERLRLDDLANLFLGEEGKALLREFVGSIRADLGTIGKWLRESVPVGHLEQLVQELNLPVEATFLEGFSTNPRPSALTIPAAISEAPSALVALVVHRRTMGLQKAPEHHRAVAALLAVLAQLAQSDGTLDESEAPILLRPLLVQARGVLEQGVVAPNNPAGGGKYVFLPPHSKTYRLLGASQRDRGVRQRMPVVDRTLEVTDYLRRSQDVDVVVLQHLFNTAVVEDLSPEAIVGKDYSTNPDRLAALVGGGSPVETFMNKSGRGVGLQEMFDNVPEEIWQSGDRINPRVVGAFLQLKSLFEGKTPGGDDQFLLVDEGGYLLELMHTPYFEAFAAQTVLVAHTDQDIQRLDSLKERGVMLKTPVVDVARSWLKKDFESPLIGESVASSIHTYATELLPEEDLSERVVTVLGYGAVGSESAKAMARRGHRVLVYDTDPAAMARAEADGLEPVPRKDALNQAAILVSATGTTALTADEWGKLPNGAIVVNAASGHHELGLERRHAPGQAAAGGDANIESTSLISRAQVLPNNQVVGEFLGRTRNLGSRNAQGRFVHDVMEHDNGKEFLTLRSGYVVNLELGVPAEFIQLTRALIVAGAAEALDRFGKSADIYPLGDAIQNEILGWTRNHLRKMGLSLAEPNFVDLERLMGGEWRA